jgi:hypothetical protein
MNQNILFLRFKIWCTLAIFFGALDLVFFLVVRGVAQQFPSDLWHEGKIILLEGDTFERQR